MLSHLLRPQIEADAAQRGAEVLTTLRLSHTRNKVLWAVSVASVMLAFIVTLIFVVVSSHRVPTSRWIYVGVAAVAIIAATGEHFRTNLAFLNRQTRNVWVWRGKLNVQLNSDFLFPHALAAYILVVMPALLAGLLLIFSTGFTRAGTKDYTAYSDVLKQLTAFAGTLLVAQIALFNFMFTQLLGKYSSGIAVAVSKHRVVRILRGYLIVLFVGLYVFYLLGFPDALPKTTFLLALSLTATLVITIWASNTGIRIDLAILYTGHHSATVIRSFIKPPVLGRSKFWNAMAALGLDWRNPERMVVTLPPQIASSAATTLASGLFNAAHKSVQENQHETFWSSLVALSLATEAYVKRRRDYFGSTDQFLAYLNDQLAALAKAAAKSPNEYMVTNTVTTIGTIGALALEVGRGPNMPNAPKAEIPESHPFFSDWQTLLGECFELTHGLMRTTAASEVLTQLSKLTKKAIDLRYAEDASMTFPAGLNRIYTTCLAKRTPYHLNLAGQCVTAIMEVWTYSLGRHEAVMAGVSKAMCDTVRNMALAFQAVENLPSFDLRDPPTSLTSKFSEEQVTLQDIALSILTRPVKDRWQRSWASTDFEELSDLVGELLKDATAKDISFARQYGDAFYEFALLIFTALPNEWNEPEQPAEKYFNISRPTVQELVENKLSETIQDLIPLYYRSRTAVLDWNHKLFSIIGMAAAIYAETGRESARLLADKAILRYRDLIVDAVNKKERVPDEAWDYLQLVSVWVRHLLKDVPLADAIVDAVAKHRPFIFSPMFLSGGKQGWGAYGYPNIRFLNSDFFLPYPRNIGPCLSETLKETVKETVKRWQGRLMNPDELRETYKRIHAIREPIRKKILERLERERQEGRHREPDSK
jgi:hypothetical protein